MDAWSVRLLVVSLTAACLAGCFGSSKVQVYAAERDPPQALEVEDGTGASFAAQVAPRHPAVRLAFASGPPPDAEHALVWLRGAFHGGFLARYTSARQSNAFKQRSVAVAIDARADALLVRPLAALEPSARYTLAWLVGEGSLAFSLRASNSPAQGARLVESWPSPGDTRVPVALAAALLRFDGRVVGDFASHVLLRTAAGDGIASRVAREPCEARGFAPGDCAWVTPTQVLPAGRYQLALSDGLTGLDGAAIDATQIDFQTAGSTPPSFTATTCALDEQASHGLCVRSDEQRVFVRGSTSSSSWVTVGAQATLTIANTFTLATAAEDAITVQLRDLGGQHVSVELAATLAPDLARVTIDELRADPLGKEPTQEYVELLNYGDTAVSLAGFSVTRDPQASGRRIVGSDQAVVLAPSERALLVAPDFDPSDTSDGALPGGVRLIALDGALSLGNDGDTLFLRDAVGRRVAAATSLAALVEGQCSARYRPAPDLGETAEDSDPRRGDGAAFELDPDGTCTPGRATFPTP